VTTAEEARFIELWQQDLETAAIAQHLGIPPGTARSRAYTLQQQGNIAPRPRGGRRTPARQKVQEIVATADDGGMHSPVHMVHKVQAQLCALHGAEQKDLSPEDLKSERWNFYMPRWLRQLVEAEAAANLSPSQVLQGVVRAGC
jgi:hypothetical protein